MVWYRDKLRNKARSCEVKWCIGNVELKVDTKNGKVLTLDQWLFLYKPGMVYY